MIRRLRYEVHVDGRRVGSSGRAQSALKQAEKEVEDRPESIVLVMEKDGQGTSMVIARWVKGSKTR